jgi:multidrug efflux pump subunit AcrA (membrane-fusion protein)
VGFDKLDPRILPEMSVKVGFHEAVAKENGGSTPAANRLVAIPKAALFQDNGKDIVYVIQSGKAERRAVTVGNSSPDEVTLSAGLSPGERVATERPNGLGEGTRVKEATQ